MLEPRTSSRVFQYMKMSHEHLDDLFESLLEAMRVAAPEVNHLWTQLDHELLAHMEAEERYVLPKFAHVDRAEAVAMLRDHAAFREQLLELGIAVDLHRATFAGAKEFIATLRRHAAAEEKLLYLWADEQLGPAVFSAIRQRMAMTR